jgi:polysaccharide export outer membrane protein
LTAGCHVIIRLPPEPGDGAGASAASPAAPAQEAQSQGVRQTSYSVPVKVDQTSGPGVIRADMTDPDDRASEPGGGPQPWRPHLGPADCGLTCAACASQAGPGGAGSPHGPIPRELDKVSLPDYIIEPPDVLLIETLHGAPLPPYHIEPLDALQIQVTDTLPNEPIAGVHVVEPEGTVNLGLSYGSVPVAGLSVEQARAAITSQLQRVLKNPTVAVALARTRGLQQAVRGEHLVRPDGTISLGAYGCVYVAGLNLGQAREAIEHALAGFLLDPQISVDVLGYNSKVYYLIFDGGGYGQQIFRMPVTGNETVLDAIGLVNGLPAMASTKRIWVARPAPAGHGCDQVLPVDWNAITQGGSTATNYQLFPGDRIYVKADPWVCFDNAVAKVLLPFERMLGLTLLTEVVVREARTNRNTFVGVGFCP